jgi:predicted transcriptional regulator
MEALALVDQGLTRYAAAKQIGISESAVHRAWHRRQGKEICPTCNQIIP